MNYLYLIPARGGSKGIPHKNIKPLAGKPLIEYTLEVALQLSARQNICLSSDDDEIIRFTGQFGLQVPFKRPAHLATDEAGTYQVMLHALDFYENTGQTYEALILLQPTSPFRTADHVREAIALFHTGLDMVVSVCETRSNPYYVLFEEDENGYLVHSKKGNFTRRQDCPSVYEYNGAVYIINTRSLKTHSSSGDFTKVVKYLMPPEASLDIDTPLDWDFAEFLMGRSST